MKDAEHHAMKGIPNKIDALKANRPASHDAEK
jgi:hypothetical protein